MSEEKLCDWDGDPVRGRYATIIMPNGETKYLHGKCRWFPEAWKKLGSENNKKEIREGPDGEVIYVEA